MLRPVASCIQPNPSRSIASSSAGAHTSERSGLFFTRLHEAQYRFKYCISQPRYRSGMDLVPSEAKLDREGKQRLPEVQKLQLVRRSSHVTGPDNRRHGFTILPTCPLTGILIHSPTYLATDMPSCLPIHVPTCTYTDLPAQPTDLPV